MLGKIYPIVVRVAAFADVQRQLLTQLLKTLSFHRTQEDPRYQYTVKVKTVLQSRGTAVRLERIELVKDKDLINIERFHAYVKTIVRQEPVPPFSMDTTKDLEVMKKQANPKVGQMIKELSRLTYGRDMAVVEAEIAKRAKL